MIDIQKIQQNKKTQITDRVKLNEDIAKLTGVDHNLHQQVKQRLAEEMDHQQKIPFLYVLTPLQKKKQELSISYIFYKEIEKILTSLMEIVFQINPETNEIYIVDGLPISSHIQQTLRDYKLPYIFEHYCNLLKMIGETYYIQYIEQFTQRIYHQIKKVLQLIQYQISPIQVEKMILHEAYAPFTIKASQYNSQVYQQKDFPYKVFLYKDYSQRKMNQIYGKLVKLAKEHVEKKNITFYSSQQYRDKRKQLIQKINFKSV